MGTGPQVTLDVEIVGDYVIGLSVSAGDDCASPTTHVTLHVQSQAGIHVQLTWPQAYGDVDLHYIGPGGTLYEESPYPGDLDWEYSLATAYGAMPPTATGITPPDWGGPGTVPNNGDTVAPDGTSVDDASLDCDQRDGFGPENVTHNQPFDGTYRVSVHYYCAEDELNGNAIVGRITANLDIFVNGSLAWSGSMPGISEEQVWDAAEITVANHGTSISVTSLSTPLYCISQGCGAVACPPPADGIFDAGPPADGG
jgi:hypothetical protein